MKKLFIIGLLSLFLLTGCGNDMSPTGAVEKFLSKYQKMDSEVLAQLDKVVSEDSDMSDEQKSFLTTLKKNLIPKREQKLNISKRANQYGEEKDIQNVSGNRRVLVVLVEFSDLRFRKTKEDFVDLFNKTNYNDDGAVGSVKDYYLWASHEQLNLQSDIIGPYTLSHNMAYYGRNNIKS